MKICYRTSFDVTLFQFQWANLCLGVPLYSDLHSDRVRHVYKGDEVQFVCFLFHFFFVPLCHMTHDYLQGCQKKTLDTLIQVTIQR